MPTQEEMLARATALQARYTDDLMHKKHVQGTAVGLAKVDGKYTDLIAIIVLVDQKVPESELAPEDIAPRQIEGMRVDVQEIGIISAQ